MGTHLYWRKIVQKKKKKNRPLNNWNQNVLKFLVTALKYYFKTITYQKNNAKSL